MTAPPPDRCPECGGPAPDTPEGYDPVCDKCAAWLFENDPVKVGPLEQYDGPEEDDISW